MGMWDLYPASVENSIAKGRAYRQQAVQHTVQLYVHQELQNMTGTMQPIDLRVFVHRC